MRTYRTGFLLGFTGLTAFGLVMGTGWTSWTLRTRDIGLFLPADTTVAIVENADHTLMKALTPLLPFFREIPTEEQRGIITIQKNVDGWSWIPMNTEKERKLQKSPLSSVHTFRALHQKNPQGQQAIILQTGLSDPLDTLAIAKTETMVQLRFLLPSPPLIPRTLGTTLRIDPENTVMQWRLYKPLVWIPEWRKFLPESFRIPEEENLRMMVRSMFGENIGIPFDFLPFLENSTDITLTKNHDEWELLLEGTQKNKRMLTEHLDMMHKKFQANSRNAIRHTYSLPKNIQWTDIRHIVEEQREEKRWKENEWHKHKTSFIGTQKTLLSGEHMGEFFLTTNMETSKDKPPHKTIYTLPTSKNKSLLAFGLCLRETIHDFLQKNTASFQWETLLPKNTWLAITLEEHGEIAELTIRGIEL